MIINKWWILVCSVALAAGFPVSAAAQNTEGPPPAQVAVSPPRLEVNLDEMRATESIQILNLSDEETHIRVSVGNWDMDESNKVRDVAPTEQSLDQWIVINPLQFTIPPNEQQTIRFAVRPKVAPEPGEHRAMIYFEQQPQSSLSDDGVSIRYRLGVAVYGLSGHIDRRGHLLEIRHREVGEDLYLELDVLSEGNASVRLQGRHGLWPTPEFPGDEAAATLLDAGGADAGVGEALDVVGLLPELPILPGTKRTISTKVERPDAAGAYTWFVQGSLSGRPFTRAVQITIP